MEWERGPKRGAFDETSWACALVLKSPTEKRKFLCGARKGGGAGGGGVGPGGVGCSWSGAGRGGAGKGGGSGGRGVGWSGRVVKRGGFWWVNCPKTETRKFLGGVPGQGGAGRDGSGGGAGVGLGGLGGVGGGSQARNCPKWLGSWTGWSRKGGGSGGGGGSGAGEVGWTGRGVPSAEQGRRLRGHSRWNGSPHQKNGSFWLGFLDRVEQEGTGAGGGGEWGWGGLGGVGGGSQARTFWWDLVGMRVLNCPKQKNGSFWLGFLDSVEQENVGSELPKTEKRKFLVGFLDRVE